MAISFRCQCGKKLSAKDEMAGRSVRCPACSTVLKIPVPGVEPKDEPEDVYALEETFAPCAGASPDAGVGRGRSGDRIDNARVAAQGRSKFVCRPQVLATAAGRRGRTGCPGDLYLVLRWPSSPSFFRSYRPRKPRSKPG